MVKTAENHREGMTERTRLLFCTCATILLFGCNGPAPTSGYRPEPVPVTSLVPQATDILRQSLSDPDPFIRVDAIEVIASTEQIRFMPTVQRMLKDRFPWVRFAAALAVGDLKYALAEKELVELAKDQDQNARIAAAYAMNRLGWTDSFELFRNAVASEDQTVRANAALLLGKNGDKNALKYLWATLRRDDSDYMVRLKAAEAIAQLGDERIFPKLWAQVYSGFIDDRIMGIRAMGALGTPKARDVLITKLDDDALEVRLAAAEQLGALGDKTGQPEVLDVFKKKLTARMRGEALERANVLSALAIGRIGTPQLTQYLPRLLRDPSKSVRIMAAKAVFQCSAKTGSLEKAGIRPQTEILRPL